MNHCHVIDLLPTFIELAAGTYPAKFGGKDHPPLPGVSLAPLLKSGEPLTARLLYFSLFNNMALIDHGWKMVTAYNQPWQLYDLNKDRTETHDLATERPEKLQELLNLQKAFAAKPDVALRLQSGEREPEYAPGYRPDGSKGPGAREEVPDPELALLAAKARSQGRQLNAEEIELLRKQSAAQKARKARATPVPEVKCE